MATSILADGFAHHAWATLRLIDACSKLTPEQLNASVPGIYGSILTTLNHMVASDSYYLARCTDGEFTPWDDEEQQLNLPELRAAVERQAAGWEQLLERDLDPDAVTVARLDDGSEYHAPLGLRLAQVLHHGTDHRSQVCTVMTSLGIEPPGIDLWDYGDDVGRTKDVPAPA